MQPFPDLLSSEKPESTFASYPLNMLLLKFMDLLAVCRQEMCWRVMVSDGHDHMRTNIQLDGRRRAATTTAAIFNVTATKV